jgi:hypothetical protein
VPADPDSCALIALVEDERTEPDDVRLSLVRLLQLDPRLGARTALGVLSREPRIKPSSGLLVDPGDTVLRRWHRRVAAGRALVASAVLPDVFDELHDELTECPDLARDVLAGAAVAPVLSAARRAVLAELISARGDTGGSEGVVSGAR